jgi:hypothetical protein
MMKESTQAGAAAALAGTGALMAAGAVEAGSPWAPFNTLARVLVDGNAGDRPEFGPRITPVGLAINLIGLAGWGFAYRCLFPRVRPPLSLLTGALAGAALYLLDYHAAPPELRPGFERYLSPRGIAFKYGAIAAALALTGGRESRE